MNANDVVSVTVTMSEATNVVTSGGTPTLALVMGTTTVQAAYASGSGSTALVFTYTILANQTVTDGISIAANSLALNGGTLADAAGNAVTLTHTAVAANTGYLVDTVAPTNQDTVLAAAVSKAADEAVTIVSSGDATGSVWLAPAGTTSFVAGATMTTASGTASSILAPATDGLYKLYVIDAAGNVSSASTSTLTVASTGYRVTGIAITGATGIANNSLNANDVVSVTVTMSEATTVVISGGRPTLALLIGGTTVQAAYASGSGTTDLVFTYAILSNQNQMDTDGISIAANSLALAGGTLKNAAGDAASLTHRDVAANTGYLVDTVAPTTQNTLLAASLTILGGTAVTIASPNEVNGSVWFAPYLTSFVAGPNFTTASGTATSILAPTAANTYRLYVVDAAGNVSNSSNNYLSVFSIQNNSAAYSTSAYTLVLTGQNHNALLATGEPLTTDIKARLDWSKLSWDINGDNDTTANVSFALEDIVSAIVSSPYGSGNSTTLLTIVLTQAKGLSLQATPGFAGTATGTVDTLDITAGFDKDAAGNAVTTDAAVNAALSFTAPTNQNTVYASNLIKTPDAVVPIVSTGDAANSVWFAPANTSNFVAGATMTTAGGTATSILAPTTAGTYRLYVIDAVGKVSSYSSAGLWVTTSVDTTAPTVTNTSGAYSASTYTLTLTGTNYTTLLESNNLFESPTTNIKDRLDWSKLSWDINGDDDTTANVSFALEDIASANASNFPGLTIVLTSAKGASLEATSGFAGATPDTLDIAAGFDRDLSGNAATTDAKANAGLSFSAPTSTYIQPIFSSNVTKGASSAVTIVSSGNAANSIWFAPAGTTIFVAGTTMTTAGGTATSILAPASDGAYKLYLLDVLGNVSPASNGTLTVDATAPPATITSGNYAASTNTLVLTGTNYNTLLESSLFESASTDIKARLDWSKLTWDINGDDNTTGNVSFTLTDITSAKVTTSTTLTIVLATAKDASLEATSGFGGATLDTLDIQAGFAKDTWGNVATTDVAANAPLTFTAPTNQSTVFSGAATRKGAAAVTISSSGDAGNSVWFAPADTTSFVAGDTMTTAGGTATSILAPNTGGIYKLFVIDAAGARSGASTSSLTVDTTPPSVSGIAITTATTGRLNNTLNAGDVVSVTVTMNEATTVVTTGGRPTLDLLIGETSVKAAYASGNGTTALVFTYTILANQTDPDGISIAANSLALNGGTLSDAVGNAATTLTHTAVAANTGYLVDNTAPTISGVAITSATGLLNNTLNLGDVVSVTLTMSEASTVSSSNAKLMLNLNGNSVGAAYTSGNNSTALVFKYTIQFSDTDTNGISILANNLQLNSSTLSDLAGNNLVTPTFSAVADNTGYLVDTTVPSNQTTVFAANAILPGSAAVTIVSANEVNGSVWFAPAGTTSFVSGATKTTAGGTATSILAPATDGAYKLYVIDAAGNVSAASGPTLTVDGTAPTISSISFSATGMFSNTLNAGDVLTFFVSVSETINVDTTGGSPTLALQMGTATVQAAYASGTGSTQLVFTYTILAGDTDTNGISILANSLALNGGTLRDAAGNAATLTHAAVADNILFKVDTTAPVNQDAVLASNVSKRTGTQVTIASAGETNGSVWLAPAGTTNFVTGDTIKYNTGTATTVTAPSIQGVYQLFVMDGARNVSVASTASLTVDNTAPTNENDVFTAAVSKKGGSGITINAANEVGGSVWFAPSTTLTTATFAASNTMTTAGSAATSILAPATDGSYKLFVIDAAGNVSSGSTVVLTVDNVAPTSATGVAQPITATPVKGGAAVTILSSNESPNSVWLAPDGTTSFVAGNTMTKAVNGVATTIVAPATTGAYKVYVIDAAGNVSAASNNTLNVDATAPTNQDTAFASSVSKKGGAAVTIVSPNESNGKIWFAPEGTTSFVAGATMTTSTMTTSMLAPATEGAYKLFVIDAVGNVSSASTATLTVDTTAPSNQDTVLAGSVAVQRGAAITIGSSGESSNNVWLAPASVTSFVPFNTMTKAVNGVATSILAPETDGDYKLFLIDAVGNVSSASTSTVRVDSTPPNNPATVYSSNLYANGGTAITIGSSGDDSNNVWFAPAGTTSFAESDTMTKAFNGVATSILAPAREGAYRLYLIDAAGNISVPVGGLTIDNTAPSNQNAVFATSVDKVAGGGAVTIVSSGDSYNNVWFAPAGTTSFVAGATMTKTSFGEANSILAPATEGSYKLFVVDRTGNVSEASSATLSVDATAPTVTNTRGDYSASTNTLVLTGTNYNSLLEVGETASTNIKGRLDWTKLSWDIDGDDNTTGNVSFVLGDISSVNVTDGTTLTIVLTSGKGTSLEAVTGYGGATLDTLDIAAGFARDVVGNVATTDAVVNAPLFTNAAPVVVDLNRDGAISYGRVVMDVNGDGVMDSTPWAGAQDGVLVWDKFADGMVHNNSQYAFTQYGGNTDLQGLAAAFDTNHDGQFNAQDAKFGEFMVWQDANQNGVSDAGEVRSLADLGLTEIKLTSDNVVRTPADGVTEYGQTTATAADGTQVLVADVGFEYTSLGYSMGSDSAGLGTLKLADGAALNLAQVGKQSSHAVAVVDLLSDSAANALTLSLQDVLDLSGGNLFNSGTSNSTSTSATSAKQLAVLGDAQDTLHIGIGWTNSGTVVNYNGHDLVVYNSYTSAVQLLIEQAMVNANHVVI